MLIQTMRPCYRCETPFDTRKSQCPFCKAFNDLSKSAEPNRTPSADDLAKVFEPLSSVNSEQLTRILTGPWDPCFGKYDEPGIEESSVTAIGGRPGIGKSTLMLQIAGTCARLNPGRKVAYIAVEESKKPIRARAARLGVDPDAIMLYRRDSNIPLMPALRALRPVITIVDSLSRLTEDLEEQCTYAKSFKEISQELLIPTILLTHVNKDEDIAGLMALQHDVDCIIHFSDAAEENVRTMITKKNRNGEENIETTLLMTGEGLQHVNWTCPACSLLNDDSLSNCWSCNEPDPSYEDPGQ